MATKPTSTGTSGGDEPDPSMDDILASIRRILDDDPATQKPADNVLVLDDSMLEDQPGGDKSSAQPAGLAPDKVPQLKVEDFPPLAANEELGHNFPVNDDTLAANPTPVSTSPRNETTLVDPEAAAAAASSVDSLMRTLAAERTAAIGRVGLTIEDLVREEIRPLLKHWLDNHLPPVVERLVRAEIERVVGRQSG